MTGEAGIEAALAGLSRLMLERDPDFADQFTADALLVGSEPGEIADGREAIRALIAPLHARPDTLTWVWDRKWITVAGTIGWVFAEGDLVSTLGVTARRLPYRLSAVLEYDGSVWRFRQFHGSEPKV